MRAPLLALLLFACAAPAAVPDDPLARVAAVHGGHGPWAVAGYRMGEHALRALGLPRGSFDLAVIHHTPAEVQYSCVADGAAAATGASAGKLNLTLEPAAADAVRTEYVNRKTGARIALRPTAAFRARYADVAREKLGEAGREVLTLSDDEIFERVP